MKYALVAGKFEDNARRAAAMAGDHVVALVTDASPERDVLCLATMGFAFDQARCWLSRGRAQRRAKQRGAARRSLEAAAAHFDRLGSDGWARRAPHELARVGSRTPDVPGALTVTEQRVVELAAAGKSNKEIARALSTAVHTAGVHLSRAYAKLGVRSRTQLAAPLTPQRAE